MEREREGKHRIEDRGREGLHIDERREMETDRDWHRGNREDRNIQFARRVAKTTCGGYIMYGTSFVRKGASGGNGRNDPHT